MTEQITYGEMCRVIAEDWNKDTPEESQLTWEEIWDFDLIKKFPALYTPMLYEAAKKGVLTGLVLTDEVCAGMFVRYLEKRESK